MSILFIARAILKDLNKSGCFHLNWRLGMDSLDWENSQHFAISLLVSPQYKYSNFVLMMCHYLDLGSASDWSCNKGNLLQPIRSTSQIWEVTGHGYGISVLMHSSDVILLQNQWWWGNVSAVFSSYSFLCCWKLVTWCL